MGAAAGLCVDETAAVTAGARPEDGRFARGCPGVTGTKSSEAFLEDSLCLAALIKLFISGTPVPIITIFLGREGRDAA
jgi:hypothetical protein